MNKERSLKIPTFSNKHKFMSDFLRNTEQFINELPRINQLSENSEPSGVEKSPRLSERNQETQSHAIKLPHINKLKNFERELELRKKKLDSIDESKKKRDLTKISREYVEFLEYKKRLQKGEAEESYYEFDNYRNYKYLKIPSVEMDYNRNIRNKNNKSFVSMDKKSVRNNESLRASADPGSKNLLRQQQEPNLDISIISKKLKAKKNEAEDPGNSQLVKADDEDEPISARRKGTRKRAAPPNNREFRALPGSQAKFLDQVQEDERDMLHKRLIMMIEKAHSTKFDSEVSINAQDKANIRDKLVSIKKNYKLFNNDGLIDKGDDLFSVIEKNNLKIGQILQKAKHFSIVQQKKKKKKNPNGGKAKSLLQEYMELCAMANKHNTDESSLSASQDAKDQSTVNAKASEKSFHLWMLKANYEIFKYNTPEINDRILIAFGLNPASEKSKVGWECFSSFRKIILNREGTLYENVGFITKFFNPEEKRFVSLSDFLPILRDITAKIDLKVQDPSLNKAQLFDLFVDNFFYAGVIKREAEEILMEDFRQCLISRNVSHLDLMDLIIESFE